MTPPEIWFQMAILKPWCAGSATCLRLACVHKLIANSAVTVPSKSSKLQEIMMTSSNENIFRVTGPLCGKFTGPGEFPAQRPVTRTFDVFFDPGLNMRLSKQPWGWWFETPSWSLWRHRNEHWRLVGDYRVADWLGIDCDYSATNKLMLATD